MWTFRKPTVAVLTMLIAGCVFSEADREVAIDQIGAAQAVESALVVDGVEVEATDATGDDNPILPLYKSKLPPVTNVVIDNSLLGGEGWAATIQSPSDCNGERLDEAKVRQFFRENFEVPEQFYGLALRSSRCEGKATLTLADGRTVYTTIDLLAMKALVTYSTMHGLMATEFYFCPTCGWSSVKTSDTE